MTVKDFIAKTNLERTLLVGFYGGGNFGDELLLEILLYMLQEKGVKNANFYYLLPDRLQTYHHPSPYLPVFGKRGLLRALLKSRSITIGGGGLWGMDVNTSVFVLSLGLWLCKKVLRKPIYLIGVGFYGSAPSLGRRSAYFAAKAADVIIARDEESAGNFARLHPNVQKADDIAFELKHLSLTTYDDDADKVAGGLKLHPSMIFVTIRSFRDSSITDNYHQALEGLIAINPKRSFVVSLLDPPENYREGEQLLELWAEKYPNVQLLARPGNPLGLVRFFQQHHRRFAFITPQFHAIITAMVVGIPFFPFSYDNKVRELLMSSGYERQMIDFSHVTTELLQEFIHQVRRP